MRIADEDKPSVRESRLFRVLPLRMKADEQRTVLLPFVHGLPKQVSEIMARVQGLPDEAVAAEWKAVAAGFVARHRRFNDHLLGHYRTACRVTGMELNGEERQLLAGAYFTMEYAFQGAALFNPSMVVHPDQRGLPEGAMRFIMSLRAVGEGHLSSVVFCTGTISARGHVSVDPLGKFNAVTPIRPDRRINRALFRRKSLEMGADAAWTDKLLDMMPEEFTLPQIEDTVTQIRNDPTVNDENAVAQTTMESALWLARSNYQLQLPVDAGISDLLIFPHSENESRGIEDMRLVRFSDDGQTQYFGTYTAFNGERTLPMLMDTADFRTISIHTLNGQCAQNKGMSLFPRKIKGHYAMCSRIDGRNIFLMYSDMVHFWETAELLVSPKYGWEYRLMGNCGSALETKEGWLMITHGVGPLRQYAIGAMLLDLEDPMKLRGRLKEPLIVPADEARSGYVPNVVYSCGGLIWGNYLYLPYGVADEHTAIAAIELEPLLHQILQDGP